MHHKMQDPGAIKDHAVSISPIADVTDAVLKAKERTRPIDIEFRLIGAPGTHAEACGISVDRLQLVLLA
jgi:hypothetical protein